MVAPHSVAEAREIISKLYGEVSACTLYKDTSPQKLEIDLDRLRDWQARLFRAEMLLEPA